MGEERAYKAHVIVFPFHGQGHINPMLQFSKRLASRGLKITITTTLSNIKTMQTGAESITLNSVYDDLAEGGIGGSGGFRGFIERFAASAKHKLVELIRKFENSEKPVKCLVYDANLPWAVDIATQLGIVSAAFFTQSCAAVACYYPMHQDLHDEPLLVPAFSMPGLPELGLPNLQSFGSDNGCYHPIIKHILSQFDGIDKANWVLFNSFDKLEEEVVKWMTNLWPVRTIGPTIPSAYLDDKVENDRDYGFSLYKPDSDACMKWLNTKETGSVVFVSFGSAASLSAEQMAEMAWALKQTRNKFLWVVRETEASKLPTDFVEEASEKGLVLTWCPQLEVLAHKAVGCFITHCGWNSTVEAISFGVPMVGMPQFLDQMTNSYFVEKVWGVGLQPKGDEKGIASREEVVRCIEEIFQGEKGPEIRRNAMKWKGLAKEAVDEGGSSDKYIDEIVSRLVDASH